MYTKHSQEKFKKKTYIIKENHYEIYSEEAPSDIATTKLSVLEERA